MADTDAFSDQEIIAKTAWGEARSLGIPGMTATINTGQNRLASGVTWWESRGEDVADTLRSIFLFHLQYSCWNSDDPNRALMLSVDKTDEQYSAAMCLAALALNGELSDITSGATNYFDQRMPKPPDWSIGKVPCFAIDPHSYFRLV